MPKSHNNTNKLTEPGGDRPATPVICEVKILFLSMESGGVEEIRSGPFLLEMAI